MNSFFEGMPQLLVAFWWVAGIASVIFLLQTILTFAGIDGGDGLHTDGDFSGGHDASFQMFSFRNMINFLLGFGWTGVALYNTVGNATVLVLLATVVGAAFVAIFFVVIRQLLRLTEDNTFRIETLRGQTGTVYLRIPAENSGTGKVQISARNTSHELPAITHGDALSTGSRVRVTDIQDGVLIVTPEI